MQEGDKYHFLDLTGEAKTFVFFHVGFNVNPGRDGKA